MNTHRAHQTEISIAKASLEMRRQDAKWGPQTHNPERWLAILVEEVGEVADAINAITFDGAKPETIVNMETELLQVAAVAIQAATDLRMQREKKPDLRSHDDPLDPVTRAAVDMHNDTVDARAHGRPNLDIPISKKVPFIQITDKLLKDSMNAGWEKDPVEDEAYHNLIRTMSEISNDNRALRAICAKQKEALLCWKASSGKEPSLSLAQLRTDEALAYTPPGYNGEVPADWYESVVKQRDKLTHDLAVTQRKLALCVSDMQHFVDRVDNGTIRSVTTYNRFKATLASL